MVPLFFQDGNLLITWFIINSFYVETVNEEIRTIFILFLSVREQRFIYDDLLRTGGIPWLFFVNQFHNLVLLRGNDDFCTLVQRSASGSIITCDMIVFATPTCCEAFRIHSITILQCQYHRRTLECTHIPVIADVGRRYSGTISITYYQYIIA